MSNFRRVPIHWPRVRALADGHLCISGRCRTVRRRAVMLFVLLWGVRGLAILLVGAAFVALPLAVAADHAMPQWVKELLWVLVEVRRGFRTLLFDLYPQASQTLFYDPEGAIDWHLGALGLALSVAAVPLAKVVCWMMEWLPFLRRRFTIVVSPSEVRVRGWILTRRLSRREAPVVFRLIEMREGFIPPPVRRQVPSLWPVHRALPGMVEVHQGLRRLPILYVLNAGEGEAIVGRCMEALARTSPHAAEALM